MKQNENGKVHGKHKSIDTFWRSKEKNHNYSESQDNWENTLIMNPSKNTRAMTVLKKWETKEEGNESNAQDRWDLL